MSTLNSKTYRAVAAAAVLAVAAFAASGCGTADTVLTPTTPSEAAPAPEHPWSTTARLGKVRLNTTIAVRIDRERRINAVTVTIADTGGRPADFLGTMRAGGTQTAFPMRGDAAPITFKVVLPDVKADTVELEFDSVPRESGAVEGAPIEVSAVTVQGGTAPAATSMSAADTPSVPPAR